MNKYSHDKKLKRDKSRSSYTILIITSEFLNIAVDQWQSLTRKNN